MSAPVSAPSPLLGAILAGSVAGGVFLLPRLGGSVPALALPLAIAGLLSAVPLLAVRIGGGVAHSLLAVVTAFVLLVITDSPATAISFVILFGAWALAGGEALSRKKSVILAGVTGFAVLALEALMVSFAGGAAMVETTLNSPQVQKAFDQWAAQAPLPPGEAKEAVEQIRGGILVLHPALFVVSAAAIVSLNMMAVARMVQLNPSSAFPRHELLFLRWPLALVASFVASGALLLVPALRSVAWNGLVVTMFLFLLQGLSVMCFGLTRLFASELMRALLVMAMLLGPWAILLSLLGLFDQWFDFRNRLAGSEAPPAPGN